MGSSTRTQKARDAASSVGSNEYVRRLIEDEELRDSIRGAYDAGRTAYDRLQSQKHPARSVIDDKKTQRDLREAAESIRLASDQLRGRNQKSSFGFGKVLFVALIAGIAAVALSEDLRKALLDRLFGAEEEFEYTSTTAPSNGGSA